MDFCKEKRRSVINHLGLIWKKNPGKLSLFQDKGGFFVSKKVKPMKQNAKQYQVRLSSFRCWLVCSWVYQGVFYQGVCNCYIFAVTRMRWGCHPGPDNPGTTVLHFTMKSLKTQRKQLLQRPHQKQRLIRSGSCWTSVFLSNQRQRLCFQAEPYTEWTPRMLLPHLLQLISAWEHCSLQWSIAEPRF